jgi:signal transduction histidine kinase
MTITVKRTNDQITITYDDNGRGIAEEVVPKIFDPFFTTKPGEQGGTGLGLNIVFNLVTQKLEGEVWCIRQEGGGGGAFLLAFPSILQ